MIEPEHGQLSIVRQCALLSISRSGFYYEPTGETAPTLTLMRSIDEAYLMFPYYGSRQMVRHLRRDGHVIGRKKVRRLMAKMGLAAIYQKPRTSTPNPENRVHPYLLRDLAIVRPNQVWCADITYIPMQRGFMYLVAVMDWASRRVLSWRVSNSMDADFCIEALEEALACHGRPEIFNTDQGSQFTSPRFTGVLEGAGIRISMDGRGRWMDNVFIERLWRSLKYECIYLHAYETGSELRAGVTTWVGHYNTRRPHSALGGRTPNEVYSAGAPPGGWQAPHPAAHLPLAA
jgi:putative transposase